MAATCLRRMFAPWCPVARSYPSEPPFSGRNFSSVEPRKGPSTEVLGSLKSIKNIRDLSEACGNIAPGRIFRSACPVGASIEDVQILRHSLGIRRMVDLRSDYERNQDVNPADGLLSNAQMIRSGRRGNGLMADAAPVKQEEQNTQANEVLDAACSEQAANPAMQVHLLSLLERDRYYRSMLSRLPYSTAASLLFWGLFNQSYAKTMAIREINKAGLSGLYETILETAGPEIKQALEVVVESAEANEPILFFCKVGKDRTGLLASLILACCGATPEEIISDYIRSDGVDQIALGGMEKDKELKELDTAAFARAPSQAMEATIAVAKQRYGGLRGYMDSIEFSREMQRRLARSLAPLG